MEKAKTSQRLTASPLLKRFTHTYFYIYEMVAGYIEKQKTLTHNTVTGQHNVADSVIIINFFSFPVLCGALSSVGTSLKELGGQVPGGPKAGVGFLGRGQRAPSPPASGSGGAL